jgi:hypothetical protein
MSNLEKSVLSTVKALPETTPEIVEIIDARTAETKKKIGFEDWLSYIVNAGQIAIAPSSPLAGVLWRDCKSPKPDDLLTSRQVSRHLCSNLYRDFVS